MPLLLLLTQLLPTAAWAQFVDPTFTAPVQGATALAVQPDGRVIVGGVTSVHGAPVATRVVRLLPSGDIDPTFDASITGTAFAVRALTLDSSSRVLVAGSFTVGSVSMDLVRLLPNGAVDPAFTPVPGTRGAGPAGVVVQPDGRILYLGFNIRRLNQDGSPDATFTPISGAYVDVRCATILPDGRILVGGRFSLNGAEGNIARLFADGTVDATFSVSGGTTPLSTVESIAVRPDGRFLAAGGFISSVGYPIRQFTADGVLDTTFSAVALGGSTIDDLVLEPAGSVLLAGAFSSINGQSVRQIARLDSTGALDTTFVPFVTGGESRALARLSDGRVYLAGPLGSGPHVVRMFPAAVTPSLPGPPTLTAAQIEQNPVRITWSVGIGSPPTSYELQVGSRAGASDIGRFSMGLATAIEANAPPMVRLYLRVVAMNAQGSAISNEVSFILGGLSAPSPPVLSAVQVGANPVTLAWGSPRGSPPQSYTLVAGSATGQADFGAYPMGLATSVTAAAPVGVPVFVRVVAANTAGSAHSNEVSFTLSPPTRPSAPVLAPPSGSGDVVVLSWSGVAGASYVIRVRLVPGGPVIATLAVAATSTSVSRVPHGTYLVSVVAVREGQTSAESNTVTVVVPRLASRN